MVRFARMCIALLLLAALPGSAMAQEMTTPMLVQTTPTYTVVLSLGPAAEMVQPGASMNPSTDEIMVGTVGMPMAGTDTGMTMGGQGPSGMGMGNQSSSNMGTGNMGTQPSTMDAMSDMGMAVNHHLEVHITNNSSGALVNDVTPVIRIRDTNTGVSRDLNDVMAMYSAQMGPSDFHYGQNVWLPDGQYDVTIMLGKESALFRDVVVGGGGSMPMGGMGGG